MNKIILIVLLALILAFGVAFRMENELELDSELKLGSELELDAELVAELEVAGNPFETVSKHR